MGVDDILNVQDTSSNIYAFDKNTGDVLWTKEYDMTFGPSSSMMADGTALVRVREAPFRHTGNHNRPWPTRSCIPCPHAGVGPGFV